MPKTKAERCENCKWYETENAGAAECRFNAPIHSSGGPVWPHVAWFDWCGDWQLKSDCQIVTHDDIEAIKNRAADSFRDRSAVNP